MFSRDSPAVESAVLSSTQLNKAISVVSSFIITFKPLVVSGNYEKKLRYIGTIVEVVPDGVSTKFISLNSGAYPLPFRVHVSADLYKNNYTKVSSGGMSYNPISESAVPSKTETFKAYLVYVEMITAQIMLVPILIGRKQTILTAGSEIRPKTYGDWITAVNSGNSPWVVGTTDYSLTHAFKAEPLSPHYEQVRETFLVYITVANTHHVGRGLKALQTLVYSSEFNYASESGMVLQSAIGFLGAITLVGSDHREVLKSIETINFILTDTPKTEWPTYFDGIFADSYGLRQRASHNDFIRSNLPVGRDACSFYETLYSMVVGGMP